MLDAAIAGIVRHEIPAREILFQIHYSKAMDTIHIVLQPAIGDTAYPTGVPHDREIQVPDQ